MIKMAGKEFSRQVVDVNEHGQTLALLREPAFEATTLDRIEVGGFISVAWTAIRQGGSSCVLYQNHLGPLEENGVRKRVGKE